VGAIRPSGHVGNCFTPVEEQCIILGECARKRGGLLVNTHDSGSHGLEFFILGTGSGIRDIDCGLH